MTICPQCIPKDSGVWLYFFCFEGRLHEPLGPVKIGITANVAARLAAVQTGQHRKLITIAAFGTPNREIAREREGFFHGLYKAKRLEGEWFDLDPIDALAFACEAWRFYLQNLPDCLETMGIPHFEREVRAMRAWREHYAERSNVISLARAVG